LRPVAASPGNPLLDEDEDEVEDEELAELELVELEKDPSSAPPQPINTLATIKGKSLFTLYPLARLFLNLTTKIG